MNVLLLGSGGREHALAWKISQSKKLSKLFLLPGNPGTANLGENLSGSYNDFTRVKEIVADKNIDLIIVGPEEPLVNGLKDFLEQFEETRKVGFVGPGSSGARLEGSKEFSKEFMLKHGIPTAPYRAFGKGESEQACAFLAGMKAPYVLKADGLAAGKGVIISSDYAEACKEVKAMLDDSKFGKASARVVVEGYLDGIELSVFILTDGKDYIILPEAKDYKRIGENDTGLNTGGMGAVSPVPFANADFIKKVETLIIKPTVKGLQTDNIPYCGFIFIGLMNVEGEPFVIEYNCRLGDPETEVILPRIKTDFLEHMIQASAGKIEDKPEFYSDYCCTVMMVSGGYPGDYEKGFEISGLDKVENVLVFHAGTALQGAKLVSSGGRVMALSSRSEELVAAFKNSYSGAEKINFKGKYFRRDLGRDLEKYL